MRCWLSLVLVACGGGAEPEASRPPMPAPAREVAKLPPAPLSSTHGSTIVALAVTDDGGAVVSADRHGGIRIWTLLDGTREPIVIAGTAPHALGIARDEDGYVIADHDSADGVELIRVAANGAVRGRVMLAGEARIEQIEMTGMAARALVLRADQTIELVDASGARLSRLVPEPGTHIESLLVRGGRALALGLEGKALHARWIELEHHTARWGETTPALAVDPHGMIALSPDHQTIVGIRPKDHKPILVDLASGKPGKIVCGSAESEPATESSLDEGLLGKGSGELSPQPLGFYDATTIACAVSFQLAWWSTSGTQITMDRPTTVSTFAAPFAFADHRAIGGTGHQLGLFAPEGSHYLGYGFREVTQVRIAPAGLMIGTGDQQPLLLDGQLHERARFMLPMQTVLWTDLLPIDDRYVLTIATRPRSEDAQGTGTSYQVAVYDAVKHVVHQLLPYRAHESELAYEPTTRLLVSSDGGATLLLRFDPSTHSFGERIEISTKLMIKKVYLVDPALANGVVALAVQDDDGGLTVQEVFGEDLRAGAVTPRRTYELSGELRAVDRAGRLYVHGVMDKDDIAVYTAGTFSSRLPDVATRSLRPSTDGTRVAAFGDARITLLTIDGRRLWETAAWGSTDVGWTSSGELFARFQGALAKIDPTAGTLTDRQCGWAFGLAETPFDTQSNTPLVCDVAP
jgi:hypothetical protein